MSRDARFAGPLADDVVRCAADAATRDPRFERVSVSELPDLSLEVSVLGRSSRSIRPTPAPSRSAATASSSSRDIGAGCCCRRSRASAAGRWTSSCSRPASKPAWRPMRGGAGRASGGSTPKCSASERCRSASRSTPSSLRRGRRSSTPREAPRAAARRTPVHCRRAPARGRSRGGIEVRGAADLHQVRRPVAGTCAAGRRDCTLPAARGRNRHSSRRRPQQLSDQPGGGAADAARAVDRRARR